MPPRVLFLPGASGAGAFWQPVAQRLPAHWETVLFDWPGLGDVPADSDVQSFDDLASLVLATIQTPVDLVAQSMGGLVALLVALRRPELVRRLVLVATSGGVDLSGLDLEDWRAEYRTEFPSAAPFVTDPTPIDLSARLATVTAPALLLWTRADTISPPEVGRLLQSRLTRAQPKLVIVEHGDHTFAREHAAEVAPLIQAHLAEDAR
jgi:pimeloyl-ACP methyl ester carboxylesterase